MFIMEKYKKIGNTVTFAFPILNMFIMEKYKKLGKGPYINEVGQNQEIFVTKLPYLGIMRTTEVAEKILTTSFLTSKMKIGHGIYILSYLLNFAMKSLHSI